MIKPINAVINDLNNGLIKLEEVLKMWAVDIIVRCYEVSEDEYGEKNLDIMEVIKEIQ